MIPRMAAGPHVLPWQFPAETTHDGMPLGNGLLGAAALRATSAPSDSPEVCTYWEQFGLPAPQVADEANAGGWVQELPADPALGVAWRIVQTEAGTADLFVVAEYGGTGAEARTRAEACVAEAAQQAYAALAAEEAAWWGQYWSECARVALPDTGLQEMYELGMYKLAGLSMPGTPAATLQGPWVEEHRIPPWSSDCHFNINVQECYWPAYGGNQLRSLEPLWEMVQSWRPTLQQNARQFLGIEDGLMLSHAVDDRCTGMGGFWTGAIDHGSTAWVRVVSPKASHLRIENPFAGQGCAVRSNRREGWDVAGDAGVIETDTVPGEVIHLLPA